MRLFIAIRLSEEMKEALVDAQNAMYDRGVRGSFSPEENLHLTLAFIGEYPEAEPVLDALSDLRFRPFALTLDGVGCFGDLWWAGVGESAALKAVARRVRRALAEAGIPFDRKRFAPHVTLLRRASSSAWASLWRTQPSARSLSGIMLSLARYSSRVVRASLIRSRAAS